MPLLFAYGINRFTHDVAHIIGSQCCFGCLNRNRLALSVICWVINLSRSQLLKDLVDISLIPYTHDTVYLSLHN